MKETQVFTLLKIYVVRTWGTSQIGHVWPQSQVCSQPEAYIVIVKWRCVRTTIKDNYIIRR